MSADSARRRAAVTAQEKCEGTDSQPASSALAAATVPPVLTALVARGATLTKHSKAFQTEPNRCSSQSTCPSSWLRASS